MRVTTWRNGAADARRSGGVVALGLAVVLAGCSSSGPTAAPVGASPTGAVISGTGPGVSGPGGTSSAPTSGSSSATPTSASPTAAPTGTPSASSQTGSGLLRPGAAGAQVLALQQRLSELGYWLGTPDGHYGDVTAQAVTAVQKVAGLQRDGILGPKTRASLDAGVRPSARSTAGRVIEVDLSRQVLLVVNDGHVDRIINTSTGSGAWYSAPNGQVGHAVTPPGHYSEFRAVDGWDTSPLGRLYRPRYFDGGIAVHGYPAVPPEPASHGCVRVSLPAMDMIWNGGLMSTGTPVWVY